MGEYGPAGSGAPSASRPAKDDDDDFDLFGSDESEVVLYRVLYCGVLYQARVHTKRESILKEREGVSNIALPFRKMKAPRVLMPR